MTGLCNSTLICPGMFAVHVGKSDVEQLVNRIFELLPLFVKRRAGTGLSMRSRLYCYCRRDTMGIYDDLCLVLPSTEVPDSTDLNNGVLKTSIKIVILLHQYEYALEQGLVYMGATV